ncbi:MAG: hypothetical protein DHS20C18_27230 [Saprospiraceae bacterium]|nr:MAG: hypothetical protein DHS20C18_27230 [Saprospiraceae bacterium]
MKKSLIFLLFLGCSLAAFAQPAPQEVFVVVEEMPRFPGCENSSMELQQKMKCADQELNQYIRQNLVYPNDARQKGIQGTVVIRFIVMPDGSITEAKINRDIGSGCGQSALKLVTDMNKKGIRWIAGKQRNKKVPVHYNLPIKFTL